MAEEEGRSFVYMYSVPVDIRILFFLLNDAFCQGKEGNGKRGTNERNPGTKGNSMHAWRVDEEEQS